MNTFDIGIYKIVLLAYPKNRVVYVGQSRCIKKRIWEHKNSLKHNKHVNPHLQNLYNKHGAHNIRFELIKECSIQDLDSVEQFYIDELMPECNIIRDVKCLHDKFIFKKEQPIIDSNLPGLELNYTPQVWHRWVYGSGRK